MNPISSMIPDGSVKYMLVSAEYLSKVLKQRITILNLNRKKLKGTERVIESYELKLTEHEQRIYEEIAHLNIKEGKKPTDIEIMRKIASLSQHLLELEEFKNKLIKERANIENYFHAHGFVISQRVSLRMRRIRILLSKVDLKIEHIDKIYRDSVKYLSEEEHEPAKKELESLLKKLRGEEDIERRVESK